jgi:short-subunit dehydrogenase involved in D-alanine esterification of teichoic acids
MKVSELFDVSGYGVIVTGGASGIGLGMSRRSPGTARA